MNLNEVVRLTEAKIVSSNYNKSIDIKKAFSSDLMSDVLTLDEENVLLISGLSNIQLIRTAEMADIPIIILARNKKANAEMIKLANESGITLLETAFSIYRCSGVLFSEGLKPVY